MEGGWEALSRKVLNLQLEDLEERGSAYTYQLLQEIGYAIDTLVKQRTRLTYQLAVAEDKVSQLKRELYERSTTH